MERTQINKVIKLDKDSYGLYLTIPIYMFNMKKKSGVAWHWAGLRDLSDYLLIRKNEEPSTFESIGKFDYTCRFIGRLKDGEVHFNSNDFKNKLLCNLNVNWSQHMYIAKKLGSVPAIMDDGYRGDEIQVGKEILRAYVPEHIFLTMSTEQLREHKLKELLL